MEITLSLDSLLSPKDLFTLMQLIKESRNIVICGHYGPDGDAVGACLGWQAYLYKIGKRSNIVLPNPYPDFLRWMPGNQQITIFSERPAQAKQLIADADLIFCLDFGQKHRMKEMSNVVFASKAKFVMFDHHEGPELDAFDFAVSHPECSSTCEIVLRLIYELGGYEKLTTGGAIALYTGLMTDTGNFAYNSNRAEVFLLVNLLVQKGVERDLVYRKVFYSWSENRLKLWNHVLDNNLSFYENRRASLFTLTREEMKTYKYIRGDSEGLVNEPLKVRGMRLSISLREDTEKDVIRISLRSTNGFHCREMAEQFFNGGGHDDAAGGELPFPIEEAVKTAEKAIAAFSEALNA